MKYYAIYDDVAEECGNLFPAKNDGIATRGYVALMKTDDVMPSIKEHLKLYCVGELDITTGVFIPDRYEVNLTPEGDETV